MNAQSRFAPIALVLAIVAIAIVFVLIQGTYFGLRLKAVGKNPKAAFLLGIPTWQYTMVSFAICGLFAGLAGAVQVTAVYHRLIPSISSRLRLPRPHGIHARQLQRGHGRARGPVLRRPQRRRRSSCRSSLKLDSSLAGVLQGTLVLFVLLGEGARSRLMKKGGCRT